MTKIKKLGILALIAVFGLGLLSPGQVSSLEQRIREQQDRLSDLEGDLDARKEELAEYQNEEERLIAELNDLNYSMTLLRRELEELDQEIDITEENILVTEQELEEAEDQIAHRDEMLKNRLRVIYENGDTGYLDVLFEAYSFAEFLTRLNDLKTIAESDLELLEIAYEERRVVEEKKRELEAEKDHLLELKVQRLERRDDLNQKMANQESLLEDVQEAIDAQEQAIREVEQEAEKLDQEIEKLQEEYKQQTQSYVPSGELVWPVESYTRITSPFGYRIHPITGGNRFHGGVDIGINRSRWPGSSAYNGNPVNILAAENGVVIYAGRRGGYGNTVIIDHGQGMTTLYAHCHSLHVSQGQDVRRGEPIAIVGSTGFSTGPHLHFEVRINGDRKDPMSYFN